ncbi:MAG TPA: hypothetical protein DIU15_20025 [Deltaproteobacteria bacterium]|nr:hypothetical protein [Deltaproteobacteria bacterium]HCP48338.1 hypothetical protein [Deltaproteobacteria bacterium]
MGTWRRMARLALFALTTLWGLGCAEPQTSDTNEDPAQQTSAEAAGQQQDQVPTGEDSAQKPTATPKPPPTGALSSRVEACSFRIPGPQDGPVPSLSGFDTEIELRGSFTKEEVSAVILLTDALVGTQGLEQISALSIEGSDVDCSPGCISYTRVDQPLRPGPGKLIARAMSSDGDVVCEATRDLRVNTPPRASNLRIVPEQPTITDDIAFAVSLTDSDQDGVQAEVLWTPPEGNALDDPVLGNSSTRHGESWTLRVTPTDDLDLGEPVELQILFPTPAGVSDAPCIEGAVLRGRAPIFGTHTTCERPDGTGGFLKHGVERTWWHPKKGVDKSRISWRNGKRHGTWTTWHENSIKASETTWRDGVLHGEAHAWHEDGSPQADYAFLEGRKVGKETNWFEDGTRRYEMDAFVDGEKHGVETRWHPSGQQSARCEWQQGRRHGTCQRWAPDGLMEEEIRYENGLRHGQWTRWHLTGAKAEEGTYDRGEPVGTWTQWDQDGELLDESELR